jgi:site-specific DNA recombinase
MRARESRTLADDNRPELTSTANAPDTRKRVAIWLRVSTEDQARGDSPEHHEARARMYAEMKGWTVVTVYHLEAVSGKSVIDHPEAKRMLADVRSAAISGLIFSKLARLARSTKELLEFSEFFREHNADLISLQESIDTSTPGGRNLFRIMGSFAEWEREEIADRVAASVPIRAKLGKPLGGAAPFGYEWRDRKLVPHPDEAPVRRRLYELFLEHRRLKTVARLLNDAGHRTRNGSRFTHTTVERLIRDPAAKGERLANHTKSLGNRRKWVKKPQSEWVYTPVEPIVPVELWEACNRLLDERRQTRRPPAKRAVHLFSGLALCACGEKLYVPSNTPKYVCRRCRRKIPIADLERLFHEQLRGFFFSPEEIAEHLIAANETLVERQQLLAALERERERVGEEMEKVYRLYLADQMSPEGFGLRYRPLEERERELRDEIPRLQGEIDFLTIQHLSSDALIAEAQDLYTRWPELPFGDRRAIVEAVVEKITLGPEEVEINLAYLPPPNHPSPSENMAHGARNYTVALPFTRPKHACLWSCWSASRTRLRLRSTGGKLNWGSAGEYAPARQHHHLFRPSKGFRLIGGGS